MIYSERIRQDRIIQFLEILSGVPIKRRWMFCHELSSPCLVAPYLLPHGFFINLFVGTKIQRNICDRSQNWKRHFHSVLREPVIERACEIDHAGTIGIRLNNRCA